MIRGVNLIGWQGADATSTDLIAANPSIEAIWIFAEGRWSADAPVLPAALRPTIRLQPGLGLFIITNQATSLVVDREASSRASSPVVNGLSLAGWLGTPITSAPFLEFRPRIDSVWVLIDEVWFVDAPVLPAALRVELTLEPGTGFVIFITL